MPGAEIADDLALIEEAAREGGRIALRYFRKDPEVWLKAGDSPVSEADLAVDRYLRETLLAARPDYGWLSEETADSAERLTRRRVFVVDPIDGTRAFVAGRQTWCVSIAVVEQGESLAGALECPALDETFTAVKGGGAVMNGRGIAVRQAAGRSEIAAPKVFYDRLPRPWRDSAERVAHVPSLAYRLALIAKGSLDATLVKPGAHDWDLAAAALILEEAGGRLVSAGGENLRFAMLSDPRHGPLVAGSGALLEAALLALKGWESLVSGG